MPGANQSALGIRSLRASEAACKITKPRSVVRWGHEVQCSLIITMNLTQDSRYGISLLERASSSSHPFPLSPPVLSISVSSRLCTLGRRHLLTVLVVADTRGRGSVTATFARADTIHDSVSMDCSRSRGVCGRDVVRQGSSQPPVPDSVERREHCCPSRGQTYRTILPWMAQETQYCSLRYILGTVYSWKTEASEISPAPVSSCFSWRGGVSVVGTYGWRRIRPCCGW